MRDLRVGIDARYLSHGLLGGIHTYLENLLPALLEEARGHEFVLYVDAKRPFELSSLPSHVTVRSLPWRTALDSAYNDLFMRRQMARDRLDVVHYPANYGFGPRGTRVVITLHDAINVLPLREIVRGHARTPRTIATMAYLHYCTLAALRRASLLLTVSEHARREIARLGAFDRARIVAVPHAPAPGLRRVADPAQLADAQRRLGLGRPFVLADALKNPGDLVAAWRLLPPRLSVGRQIVFYSRHAEALPVVRGAVDAGLARLLVRPSREDLACLYSLAEAFVFPSWIEGFGIPVLEAMACGAPVIASDRGALPEVAGDAARLAAAGDPAALAQHLSVVLGSPGEAARLRQRGFARAAEFSWQRSARQTLDTYARALAT